ncbi:MAG: hypothetical protein Q4A92_01145 [Corynebacterium sp.]|nr:hypothetical protein [Corynebacterium sp.]
MFSPQSIRLEIRRNSQALTIDDNNFPSCQVSVALSDDFRAVFRAGEQTITRNDLDSLGLTALSLWDLTADALAKTHIKVRLHSIDGLEVASAAGSAVHWLAHPHSFWLLNSHLEQVLNSSIMYFAPTIDTLVAARLDSDASPQLRSWAFKTYAHSGSKALFPYGLVYERGFPKSFPQHPATTRQSRNLVSNPQ